MFKVTSVTRHQAGKLSPCLTWCHSPSALWACKPAGELLAWLQFSC